MKRKLFNLLILSLIVMLLTSSCLLLHTQPKPVVVTHTKIIHETILPCPKPSKPMYEKLDETKPLTDKRNIQVLLNNILKMKVYCDELETTVRCYEQQIKEDTRNATTGQR